MQRPKQGYKVAKSLFGKYEEIPENWEILPLSNLCKMRKADEIPSNLYIGLEHIGRGDNTLVSTGGKGKVKIHEDINHNIPIAEKIMVRYLGSLAHPMATSLMGSVRDGDSVILEITPSYYSTWDYSEKRRQ